MRCRRTRSSSRTVAGCPPGHPGVEQAHPRWHNGSAAAPFGSHVQRWWRGGTVACSNVRQGSPTIDLQRVRRQKMQYFEVLAGTLLTTAGGSLLRKANSLLLLHDSAMRWPRVAGVVVRSELREVSDSDGTSYRAELACTYSVGGKQFTTSRHTEGMTFAQPEQSARALVAAFPVGKAVEISVDSSDAGAGVLNTGKPQHMVVIRRVGIAAVLAGIALGAYGILRSA